MAGQQTQPRTAARTPDASATRTMQARGEEPTTARAAASQDAPASRRPTPRERAALAVGSGFLGLARVVSLIAAVVALVIAVAILFVVLGANHSNTIVSTVHDAGRSLAGPFDGMFKLKDAKGTLALNWGIALVVYLVIGSIVAGFLRRVGAQAEAGPRRPVRTRAA